MTNNRNKNKKNKSIDKSIEKDEDDKNFDKSIVKEEGNKSINKSMEENKGNKSMDKSMEENKSNKSIDKSIEENKAKNKNVLKDLDEENNDSNNKSPQNNNSSPKTDKDKKEMIGDVTKEEDQKIGIFWIFKKTVFFTLIQTIISPILIFGIGKALVSIPDFSPILELIFEQFGIREEHIPIFLLFLNGIVVIFFNGMLSSFSFLKTYLEKTYGLNGKVIGKTFIERINNLNKISLTNFVLFTIGVIGTLISPQANIAMVVQLSVIYTLLLIPYSLLVMMNLHYCLPLTQGALLFIYIYGFLSFKTINYTDLYDKIVNLPSVIKEIRQNTIHY
ncbi:hypothetical protein H8356DRAFT_1027599 [Neocallimastix lanati (nom. inval.)]|nr:hypothetical protein H8356DRAFT_1027599 [Neocallimastix sp. JGI-2020a]